MMDYSDYDNPQWDVDRVKLEFRTGKQARMLCQSRHISLLSSSTDATEMRSGLWLRTRLCSQMLPPPQALHWLRTHRALRKRAHMWPGAWLGHTGAGAFQYRSQAWGHAIYYQIVTLLAIQNPPETCCSRVCVRRATWETVMAL